MTFKEEKIERLKELTKPKDALPLFKYMMENADKMDRLEKDSFISSLKKGFDEAGNIALDRAFTEEILTEKEWLEIKEKYNFTLADMGTILNPIFYHRDKYNKKMEDVVILTMDNTNIYKHKEFIKKRFGVKVQEPKEAIELLKKENEIQAKVQ